MIRHIVFFSARDDIDAVLNGLEMLGNIPHDGVFEVAKNEKVDAISDAIDVVVYAEFADEAALEAWKAHPIYRQTTARVRPLRELRFSADIVSGARKSVRAVA